MTRLTAAHKAGMVFLLAAVWIAGAYGPLRSYIEQAKQRPGASSAVFEPVLSDDELMKWIRQEAPKRSVPAIDAVIDRVWKAIPGYNGREVDVQATYREAMRTGAEPGNARAFPWKYREVKPKVRLEDLPMAPIYRGNPAKPMVALMINVAWGDEYLAPMLETLKEMNAKATFFFDGTWLSKHEDWAKEIMAQGHEASNHAYTHPKMSELSGERQAGEIRKTEALLDKIGADNVWFAPPSGDYNATTVNKAGELGLRTVLWTLDTLDWKKPSSWSVVSKVSARVGPGTLVLMHPTATSQGALKGIIEAIRKKGYKLGTVSETLSSDRA